MSTESAYQRVDVRCPRCGGAEVRNVEEARTGKGATRKDLFGRLAKGPDKSGDGFVHGLEGLVLIGLGGGLAYTGMQQEKPLWVLGGVVLAILLVIGTVVVVRGDRREKAAEEAGEPRANWLWQPAHYCYGCESVFCPGGAPWQGVLTPEQFKKLVWSEAGYGDQLTVGDKARDAQVPPGTLPFAHG
ncbi:hypothetical protein [Streptomyces sp. NBC_01465]|uniref:hypothetical protein n=1 Tax=Streptomyces sp. NBC_01465 TaxID=2903878 RepID=UPI002E31423F|nr:hypothetical protein [Streptomyces sp. NBC_01465]